MILAQNLANHSLDLESCLVLLFLTIFSDQLAKQLESIKSQRDEYEDILRELALNEQEEKARLDEIAEMEKRSNDRLELQRHRDLQMKLKEEQLLAAMEEEEEYRR